MGPPGLGPAMVEPRRARWGSRANVWAHELYAQEHRSHAGRDADSGSRWPRFAGCRPATRLEQCWLHQRRITSMPKLTVEGVGQFEVPQGKRLVLALEQAAGI